MYELVQVGAKTYYIDCPTKIGIYLESGQDVWLVDSGNSRDMGKRIDKILQQQHWQLKGIISTHSHADHIGGNHFLQEKYQCAVYSSPQEQFFVSYPNLNAMYLSGGYPSKDLKNRFLYAQSSICKNVYTESLPLGLKIISLPGHSLEMIGVQTDDGVCFLADAIASETVMEKYHVIFIYDIGAYLDTLQSIRTLEDKVFIPAHAEVQTRDSLPSILDKNKHKIEEIISFILQICQTPCSYEMILQQIFQHYQLQMDLNQWILVGFTIKSYLAYLKNQDLLMLNFQNYQGFWQTK